MQAVTVVTRATAAHARALHASLAEHEPGWTLRALAIGAVDLGPIAPLDGVEIDLDAYAWHELPALARPRALARALEDGPAVYLEPETFLLAPLELPDAPLVLARRAREDPPDDDLEPSPTQLFHAGRISPALVATADPAVAAWWDERVTLTLTGSPGEPPAVDPRSVNQWLEIAATRFSGAVVADDLLLTQYALHEEERIPRPRLLHLPGFRPDRPFRPGHEGTRPRVSERPALRAAIERYAAALERAGWHDESGESDVGRFMPSGLLFDARMARLRTEARERGIDHGDVFTPEGEAAFVAWLEEPAPRGAAVGVNRLLYRVYLDRRDIPKSYPDLDGADGEAFAGWCWVLGRREMDIPDRFLPPRPAGVQARPVHGRPPAVRVLGYFRSTLGLGSAARGYVAGLEAAGIDVTTESVAVDYAVAGALGEDYATEAYEELASAEEPEADIICVNPHELPLIAERLGERLPRDRRRIGVWAWEVDAVPAAWDDALEVVDEVWCNTAYMAQAMGPSVPFPVIPLLPAVEAPAQVEPLGLELPDGFKFLFVFDYLSTLERKNPLGLIRAFEQAFAPGEGPQLILKSINAPRAPQSDEELRWAIGDRDDIHILDLSLPGPQLWALQNACDAYVSLHRAEGMGLTLAESMALAKPVVATGWSGNTEFMTARNSYLVDYELTQVGPRGEHYPSHGIWAEPDLDHAARVLRHVAEHPDEARAKGERARADVRRQLSPAATGARMRARLERLRRFDGR